MSADVLIELRGVSRRFARSLDFAARTVRALGANVSAPVVHAVDHVDLCVRAGEVVGLVGESGCGKSTVGRMAAHILEPSDGAVLYRGRPHADYRGAERRAAQLAVQMIFQDPYASLNPRMRVGDIIAEAPRFHGIVDRAGAAALVDDVMRRVGLDPGDKRRFPHQFSGGQRQRIGVARALAVRPALVVCDEAVAALDVSVQAQVLNLFMSLRREFGLAYLFISHDLSVVRHVADRIAIMYLGRIVEDGPVDALYDAPNHPYTAALLAGVPRIENRRRTFVPVHGEIPSPLAPPPGCHFHPRCSHAMARCRVEVPAMKEIAPGRRSACHLNEGGGA